MRIIAFSRHVKGMRVSREISDDVSDRGRFEGDVSLETGRTNGDAFSLNL